MLLLSLLKDHETACFLSQRSDESVFLSVDDSAGNEFQRSTKKVFALCCDAPHAALYELAEWDKTNLVYSPSPAEILIDDLCHWTSSPGAYLGAAK